MKHKIFYLIGGLSILSAIFLMCLVIYWSIIPLKVLTVKTPNKVINNPVKVGEPIEYLLDYCNYTDHAKIVHRELINDVVIGLSSIHPSPSIGCNMILSRSTTVPSGIPDGTYVLKQTVEIKLNPIRTHFVVYETEPFEITNGETTNTDKQ